MSRIQVPFRFVKNLAKCGHQTLLDSFMQYLLIPAATRLTPAYLLMLTGAGGDFTDWACAYSGWFHMKSPLSSTDVDFGVIRVVNIEYCVVYLFADLL